MKKYTEVLSSCRLFSGMTEDEIMRIMGCMKAAPSPVKDSEPVLREGDILSFASIILTGNVTLDRPTRMDREVFGKACPGDIIGIENAFLPGKLDFTATADGDVEMLFLGTKQLLEPCPNTCGCHLRMIRNLTLLLAERSKLSREREEHLSRRSTREKLLSYLVSESAKAQSNEFSIPLDRQELADFLAVDRSAMSSELSRMRADGLIEYSKNHFTLKRSK